MQHNVRATCRFLSGSDGELTLAIRLPNNPLVCWSASPTATNRYFVSDDEGGIKTHPKLTDELSIFLIVTCQLGEELSRTRTRNGAQVSDRLIT